LGVDPCEFVVLFGDQPQDVQNLAALIDASSNRVWILFLIMMLFDDPVADILEGDLLLQEMEQILNFGGQTVQGSGFLFASLFPPFLLRGFFEPEPVVFPLGYSSDEPAALQNVHEIIDSSLLDARAVDQFFGLEFGGSSGAYCV
jgi:hypothetical protein